MNRYMRNILAAGVALMALGGSQAAWPNAGGSVVCQTQAFMNTVAANITNTINSDQDPECFTGTCYPITLRPGDILSPGPGAPAVAAGDYYIDNNGDTWSLVAQPGESGSGHWYGNRVVNGAMIDIDYLACLRMINGVVYMQFAKFGGWYLGNKDVWVNNPIYFVGGDPGPGDFCGAGSPPPVPPPPRAPRRR